ncbi:cytoglobin-1-like [Triplophysa dalaica]|uniref:cytoglobin-1-like n=1 Tax=Triplophysa dalaica TaxID=1582913 RepID=UPI0024DF8CD6|nr:cytoglobin-1-like [Triplophysa dalaica]
MDAGVKNTGSITDEEVSVIQDTWRPVYEVKEDAGVAVLVRFFTNTPLAKQYFDHFRDIQDPEEMRQNVQLRKHAVRIMTALNMLVVNLRDGDKVDNIFNQMGKSHALKHKVDPSYFKIVTDVILEVLVEAFPQVFSEMSVQGAWSKLMSIMCSELNKVYTTVGWDSIKNSTEI